MTRREISLGKSFSRSDRPLRAGFRRRQRTRHAPVAASCRRQIKVRRNRLTADRTELHGACLDEFGRSLCRIFSSRPRIPGEFRQTRLANPATITSACDHRQRINMDAPSPFCPCFSNTCPSRFATVPDWLKSHAELQKLHRRQIFTVLEFRPSHARPSERH